MNWEKIIEDLLPLLGVVVGSGVTYFSQVRVEKIKIDRETREKSDKLDLERVKIYSDLLRVNGEFVVNEYVGGGRVVFHADVYKFNLRPILYEKFYLLDSGVAGITKEIDRIINKVQHRLYHTDKNYTVKELEELHDLFEKLIEEIELELKKYRENTINK